MIYDDPFCRGYAKDMGISLEEVLYKGVDDVMRESPGKKKKRR
jgi:hypothetical protein